MNKKYVSGKSSLRRGFQIVDLLDIGKVQFVKSGPFADQNFEIKFALTQLP